METQGDQKDVGEQADIERLRRHNQHQVKLALHWGEKLGLTIEQSIDLWIARYGGVYRDQMEKQGDKSLW